MCLALAFTNVKLAGNGVISMYDNNVTQHGCSTHLQKQIYSTHEILFFGKKYKMSRQAGDNDERLEELRESERTELLHSLKAKWDTVNEKYQLMVRTRTRCFNQNK